MYQTRQIIQQLYIFSNFYLTVLSSPSWIKHVNTNQNNWHVLSSINSSMQCTHCTFIMQTYQWHTHCFNGHFPDETGLAPDISSFFQLIFSSDAECILSFVFCSLTQTYQGTECKLQNTSCIWKTVPLQYSHTASPKQVGYQQFWQTASSLNCRIVVEKSDMGTTTTCISTEAVALLQDSAHPCITE